MVINYAKDFKHNYLVMKDDRIEMNCYKLKMITENNIRGLLKCKEMMVNGEGLLYYDITSKQSFYSIFEDKRTKMEDIRPLFVQLRDVCNRIQKYLLYGDSLVLDPKYIYLDIGTGEYSFMLHPVEEDPASMMPLLEYLMENVDPDDLSAVESVYQMADVLGRGYYSMSETLDWFNEEYKEEKNVPEDDHMTIVEQNINEDTDLSDESLEEEKQKESIIDRLKRLFGIKDKSREEERIFYDDDYSEYEEKTDDEEGTVFIPWVQNSEHKLYGTDRKNKNHIDLKKAPFTIGKLSGAVDVVIDDQSMSRIHAKITRQGGVYFLTDMNSTNGCFRNGMRLDPNEKTRIEPGDEIGLGRLKFIYR